MRRGLVRSSLGIEVLGIPVRPLRPHRERAARQEHEHQRRLSRDQELPLRVPGRDLAGRRLAELLELRIRIRAQRDQPDLRRELQAVVLRVLRHPRIAASHSAR